MKEHHDELGFETEQKTVDVNSIRISFPMMFSIVVTVVTAFLAMVISWVWWAATTNAKLDMLLSHSTDQTKELAEHTAHLNAIDKDVAVIRVDFAAHKAATPSPKL